MMKLKQMRRIILTISFASVFALSACMNAASPASPSDVPGGTKVSTIVPPIMPVSSPTLEGPLATVIVTFDMGGGLSAFDSMIYGQEVSTGKTYHVFMSVGDHHAEAVSRSRPVVLLIGAPGTYVFYARLTYVPELYHWGATGCQPLTECTSPLKAIEVVPDATYEVSITDRAAVLPEADKPVTVAWTK